MSAETVLVGTTWTLVLDLQGRFIKTMVLSRESEQTMFVVYTAPGAIPEAAAKPEWIVTKSFIAINTARIPTGGRVFVRMESSADTVEVNYD